MTARFKKKVRKMRGSHTHGWGAKKKHRGKGSKAGAGRSNWLFSKKSLTYSYQKERLGKRGFVVPGTKKEIRAINLEQLDTLAAERNVKEIDVSSLGFEKVLGSGKIMRPLKLKAKMVSKGAKEKILQAGGSVVTEEKHPAKIARQASAPEKNKEER